MKRKQLAKNRIIVMILVLMSLCSYGSMAQQYTYQYKKIRVQKSSSYNSIFCISKDSSGLYWLGSEQGLYRYDGNTFERIELMENQDPNLLFRVFDIHISGNELYAATNNGIFKVDLVHYRATRLDKQGKTNSIALRIIKDRYNGIWWLDSKGIVYHLKNQESVPINLNIFKGYEIYFSTILADGDSIWVAASNNGLFKINIQDHQIKRIKLPSKISDINSLKIDSSGRKFICTLTGVFSFKHSNSADKDFHFYERFGKNIYDIHISGKDTFLIKERNAVLHFFDLRGKKGSKKLDIQFESPQSFDRLFKYDGNIFMASTDGLWVARSNIVLFENILNTFNKESSVFEVPRSIVQDGKDIFLSTYNFIAKYNTVQGTNRIINSDKLITHGMIKEKDTLWIVSEGNGLVKYILPKNEKVYFNFPLTTKRNLLICLEKIDSNRILIGGYEGLHLFDKSIQKFVDFTIKKGNQIFKELQVNQIKKIEENKFLLATNNGVILINGKGEIIQEILSTMKDENSKNANAFWIQHSNSIWIGTANGVFHVDAEGNVLHHWNTVNGLAGNKIASMIGDGKSHLWIGTYTGLSAINLKTFNIINYYKEDGLPNNEFNHSSFLLANNGDIYLGTVNGFIKFQPGYIIEKQSKNTSLKLSKMEFGNQEEYGVNYYGIHQPTDPIQLGKGINFVKLQFYIDPIDPFGLSKYEYKISGVHYDWISLGESPTIHIDNFKKGDYDLQCRAITGLGSKEIITSTIPIAVSQYFYYETWFYVLLVSIILAIVIIFLFDSLKKDRRLTEIRQSIAQDLHDEIGSYLTAISMNTDLLERSETRQKNYFSEIRKLNRRAMNSLRQNIWSLGTGSDDCQHFWDHIKSMVSEQFENFDIPFNFEEIEGLKNLKLSLQQKRYLLFAMMECLTNIIKHSDGSEVSFKWKIVNDEHQIHVMNHYKESNSNSGKGYGLENIMNRMKSIGATGSFSQINGIFTLVLKLKFLS